LLGGTVQGIANTCYAISSLGLIKEHQESLEKLLGQATRMILSNESFVDKNLRQLAQTQMFAKAEGVKVPAFPPELSTMMLEAIGRSSNTVSKSSKQVSSSLTAIGFIHELEVAPDIENPVAKLLAIDFACRKQKIAIEYNGPSHYLKAVGTGKLTTMENGPTKAKCRLLKELGWTTVINLDYREHERVKGTEKEKDWLRKKLRDGGVEL